MTVAILGGVFDPPHFGHVALARAALEQLGADRLLVLVAERPGHKEVVADAGTRARLAELALGHLGEVRLDGHAYTVDLLRDEEFDEAVFVMGADEWAAFGTWKEPDEVRRLIRLAVAARPGTAEPEGDVEVLSIEPLPISSSQVRQRVSASESIADLVPKEVAREIERRGIYRNPPSPDGG
ncbi:MAG: nicotinate-nicotinamide nucleotide adenylyltransferase [Actinobacteria bacterium]|nr:nicotinate-nicotinamide nucleotide adenylyltransferase [Actinomycetota bacterium]